MQMKKKKKLAILNGSTYYLFYLPNNVYPYSSIFDKMPIGCNKKISKKESGCFWYKQNIINMHIQHFTVLIFKLNCEEHIKILKIFYDFLHKCIWQNDASIGMMWPLVCAAEEKYKRNIMFDLTFIIVAETRWFPKLPKKMFTVIWRKQLEHTVFMETTRYSISNTCDFFVSSH